MVNRTSKKGQLKWRNIFYFLSYSVDELSYLTEKEVSFDKVSCLLDLLGGILCELFYLVYSDGLYSIKNTEDIDLENPYGKLNLIKSVKSGVYATGRINCTVSNRDTNNLVNQVIKSTIHNVIYYKGDESIQDDVLKNRLSYAESLLNTVDIIDLNNDIFDNIMSYNNNLSMYYKSILYICLLIYKMYICNDSYRDIQVPLVNWDDRLCYIWEKYINNFIKHTFKNYSCKYQVKLSDDSRADTLLEAEVLDKCIIVDSKWYTTRTTTSTNINTLKGYCLDYIQYYENMKTTGDVSGLIFYAADYRPTEVKKRREYEKNSRHIVVEEWLVNICADDKDAIESKIIAAVEEHLNVQR